MLRYLAPLVRLAPAARRPQSRPLRSTISEPAVTATLDEYVDGSVVLSLEVQGRTHYTYTVRDYAVVDRDTEEGEVEDNGTGDGNIDDSNIENSTVEDNTIERGEIEDSEFEAGSLGVSIVDQASDIDDSDIEHSYIEDSTIDYSEFERNYIEHSHIEDLDTEESEIPSSMATYTPRARPSLRNLSSSTFAASTPTTRRASDMGSNTQDLRVGDTVDVPGGMDGIVKFVGEVRGKQGYFVGVELSRRWASRGKNDGDAEG